MRLQRRMQKRYRRAAIQGGRRGSGRGARHDQGQRPHAGPVPGWWNSCCRSTLGDDFQSCRRRQPICGCTELTHEDVRRLIKSKPLKSQEPPSGRSWDGPAAMAVMSAARRSTITCCRTGRWSIRTIRRVAFINERKHANIQKDGTYSAWCRACGGGSPTPHELRAIADAADKYDVPTVQGDRRPTYRPAGGARAKTCLTIWADLNRAPAWCRAMPIPRGCAR